MRIWQQSVPPADAARCQTLAGSLRASGIEVVSFRPQAVAESGILIVDRLDDDIPSIRSFSQCGLTRILILTLSQEPPASSALWESLRAGASEVLHWNGSPECIANIVARLDRWETIDGIIKSPVVRENLVGDSPAWRQVLRRIVEVARFTASSIMISGESGTGKELVARLIHTLDPRPDKERLVVLDCSTIVAELSGSEFFGHERGAFTGAIHARQGAFALAHKGTLFLDEVGELPPVLQAELLRAIQERTYKPLGSNRWHETAFRLVSASNRPLRGDKAEGRFRSDLYYRMADWTCHLPSLRDRAEDILPLAMHFVRQARPDGDPLELSDPVREFLLGNEYPGNIRELRQVVTRMVHRHVGRGPITPGDIADGDRPGPGNGPSQWRDEEFESVIKRAVTHGATLREIGQFAEETAIQFTVAAEGGSLRRAAHRLGVVDRTLQMKYAAWRRRDTA